MATGYEVQMYHNIERSRRALERIADALETLVQPTAPPPEPPAADDDGDGTPVFFRSGKAATR